MDELVERLRSDEDRDDRPNDGEVAFDEFHNGSRNLSEAERDRIGVIEDHAGKIHDIYQDVDEGNVSERELALMYAYGQLARWVVDECGTPEQQKEDLMRRLTSIEESDSR